MLSNGCPGCRGATKAPRSRLLLAREGTMAPRKATTAANGRARKEADGESICLQ